MHGEKAASANDVGRVVAHQSNDLIGQSQTIGLASGRASHAIEVRLVELLKITPFFLDGVRRFLEVVPRRRKNGDRIAKRCRLSGKRARKRQGDRGKQRARSENGPPSRQCRLIAMLTHGLASSSKAHTCPDSSTLECGSDKR